MTVLFGKSGLGKTSLLKAGLFPGCAKSTSSRSTCGSTSGRSAPRLVDQLRDALDRTIAEEHVDATAGIQQGTLWEYMHRADLELWSEQNHPLVPVLVIDQFEEVFTLGEGLQEEVERFKVDFGDLAENRIPKTLEARWRPTRGSAQPRPARHALQIAAVAARGFPAAPRRLAIRRAVPGTNPDAAAADAPGAGVLGGLRHRAAPDGCTGGAAHRAVRGCGSLFGRRGQRRRARRGRWWKRRRDRAGAAQSLLSRTQRAPQARGEAAFRRPAARGGPGRHHSPTTTDPAWRACRIAPASSSRPS